jgi:hypothetical protein
VPSLLELARDTIATTKSLVRDRRPILEHASSTTLGALLDVIEEFEERVDDATPREIRDYAIELERLSAMLTAEVWRAQRSNPYLHNPCDRP